MAVGAALAMIVAVLAALFVVAAPEREPPEPASLEQPAPAGGDELVGRCVRVRPTGGGPVLEVMNCDEPARSGRVVQVVDHPRPCPAGTEPVVVGITAYCLDP